MEINHIIETYFDNKVKKKDLYQFKQKTKKGNIIEGYICRKPNEYLGSMFIEKVNNEDNPQFIHSMPKIHYYSKKIEGIETEEIIFHEKLDGSCIIYYPLYQDGEVIEVIPKTRNTVIADDFIFNLLKKAITYPIEKIVKEYDIVLMFELYGVLNQHEIYNPDAYCSLTLIGGYSINTNQMYSNSMLDSFAEKYNLKRPRHLITVHGFRGVYFITFISPYLQIYYRNDRTSMHTSLSEVIQKIKKILSQVNQESYNINGFALTEGVVANMQKQIGGYLKVKPEEIELKHKGIPTIEIKKEVRKYWDEYGSKIEAIYKQDKKHYLNYVKENLAEDFPIDIVESNKTKKRIEKIFFTIWDAKTVPIGIQEIARTLCEENPELSLSEIMNIFSQQYPQKKNQARMVYSICKKIKGED